MLALALSSPAALNAQTSEEPDPEAVFDLLRICVDRAAAPADVIPACTSLLGLMPFSPIQEANMRFNRGTALFAQGDYAAAAQDFSDANRLDPSQVDYALRKATSLRLTGDLEAAAAAVELVLSGSADLDRAFVERARIRAAMGDFESALNDLDQAEKENSGLLEMYQTRGSIYHSLNRLEEAEQVFTQGIMIGRTNPDAYATRGHFYFETQRFKLAMQDGYVAVSLGDERPEVLRLRGVSYMMIDEPGKALDDLLAVLETAPSEWQTALRDMLEAAGISWPTSSGRDEAQAALQAAIALKRPELFPSL